MYTCIQGLIHLSPKMTIVNKIQSPFFFYGNLTGEAYRFGTCISVISKSK